VSRTHTKLPVSLVPAHDQSWDSWLEGTARDVYHLSGYHAFAETAGEGDPYLLIVGDHEAGLAWPYLLRSIEGVDAKDVTSVYGYPGPVTWGLRPDDGAAISFAWIQLVEAWREQGAVSVFTRFHPLLGNAWLATAIDDAGGAAGTGAPVLTRSQTVSIDCTLADDEAVASYTKSLRQEVASSRRAGLTTYEDEEWASIADFVRLYKGTMDRSGAAQRYYLSAQDTVRLRDSLDGHLHLLVTRTDDAVAAAGLFTEYAGLVQAYLVGTDADLHALSPLKVLLDDARRWARVRGSQVLHLGGGRGGRQDTLFAFKKRFSPMRHTFVTAGWVLDAATYRELSRCVDEAAHAARFFPAYRYRGETQTSRSQ
jgi:hypothetical protein